MDTPPPIPPIEYEGPIFDVFGNILKMIRVFAILCAIVFTGAGGMLAWEFFFFVKGIVQAPGPIVEQWQTAMAPEQELFGATAAPVAPPAVVPAPAATLAPDAPEATSPDTPTPVPAAPEVPVPLNVPEATPEPKPVDEDPTQFHPARNDDAELFLNFASSVLDRFDAGHYSWLVGMCFLAVFCWILGKVPGVMISVGAKVLVELLNADKPKPRGISGL